MEKLAALITAFALMVQGWFLPAPCSEPIPYRVGTVDARFGMSGEMLESNIATAADIWGDVAGKPLFVESDEPSEDDLVIDLIYDERQEATDKMRDIGMVINNSLASYEALKSRYESLSASYKADSAKLEEMKRRYKALEATYEAHVAYWNERGGAPKPQYDSIKLEQAQLSRMIDEINTQVAALNRQVGEVNAAGTVLNGMVQHLNLNVDNYNRVGSSTGGEFDEGEYREDSTGRRIVIYQYMDEDALVRVLAHELGHAIGLEHVADEDAIMYMRNQSKNIIPTSTDKAELLRICDKALEDK